MEPLTHAQVSAIFEYILTNALPNTDTTPCDIIYETKQDDRRKINYSYIHGTIRFSGRKYRISVGFEEGNEAALNIGTTILDITDTKAPIELLHMTLENAALDTAPAIIHAAIPVAIRAV